MFGFCPLASGSKGNAIFLGSKKAKVLIDLGISYKQLEIRLEKLSLTPADIDAIFVTHEHLDHIMGIKLFCQKHQVPVIANFETAKGIYHQFKEKPSFKIFTTGEPFNFLDLQVQTFSVQHDTLDPVGYVFDLGGYKVGVCSDLGFVTTMVYHQLKEVDLLYIEANHEVDMVHSSARPDVYKKRVLGRQGHLSNLQCKSLLEKIQNPKLKSIYLAHLSSECNSPEKALQVMDSLKEHMAVKVCPQHQIAEPYYFEDFGLN
ncbi:MAG TPA: MBL fold metallo-hydrolase [Chlamydiales bacterium]|nr:MBL fold metallo-hydrolase [Chlamydiales bacterium]